MMALLTDKSTVGVAVDLGCEIPFFHCVSKLTLSGDIPGTEEDICRTAHCIAQSRAQMDVVFPGTEEDVYMMYKKSSII